MARTPAKKRNASSNQRPAASRSWIVSFWAAVFYSLSRISVFELVRASIPSARKNYRFVEYYVFVNTLASVIALVIGTWRWQAEANLVLLIAALYGAFRTFEIVVYQVNVLLFDELRKKLRGDSYAIRGYRRTVVLLLHNYFEITCWFGVVYIYFYRNGEITVPPEMGDPNLLQVFRESMLLMFAFNPEKYAATSNWAVFAFSSQALVGVFMTIMVFARFLALLPKPDSMDEFEQD